MDEKSFSEEEKNEPIGGTIEVFKMNQMLKKDYVESITFSMSVFEEYSYGTIVIY